MQTPAGSLANWIDERESSNLANQIRKVELVLGNYASKSKYDTDVSATGSHANYPVSKITDGRRSEIDWDDDGYDDYWKNADYPSDLPQYASLVAWWKLEETSGTRYDETANDHDLTDINTVLYGTGIIENGADFEVSNNEYLRRTTLSSDIPADFTINFWVKHESSGTMQMYASDGREYSGYQWTYQLYYNADKTIRWYCNTADGYEYANTTQTVDAGSWYMMTFMRAANGKLKMFINGVETSYVHQGTVTGTTYANSEYFIMGAYDHNSIDYSVDGLMDEFMIWSKALSDAEITALYAGGAPTRTYYNSKGIPGTQEIIIDLFSNPNIQQTLDTKAEWDLGTFSDTQDDELTDQVALSGLYETGQLTENANCKLFFKMEGAAGFGEIDNSGNGNNAYPTGSIPSVAGIIGNCRGEFSATKYLEVVDSTGINPGDEFSIGGWVKRTGVVDSEIICRKRGSGGAVWNNILHDDFEDASIDTAMWQKVNVGAGNAPTWAESGGKIRITVLSTGQQSCGIITKNTFEVLDIDMIWKINRTAFDGLGHSHGNFYISDAAKPGFDSMTWGFGVFYNTLGTTLVKILNGVATELENLSAYNTTTGILEIRKVGTSYSIWCAGSKISSDYDIPTLTGKNLYMVWDTTFHNDTGSQQIYVDVGEAWIQSYISSVVGYQLKINTTSYTAEGNLAGGIVTSHTAVDTNWHFVMMTYVKLTQEIKMYFDGVCEDTSVAPAGSPLNDVYNLILGYKDSTDPDTDVNALEHGLIDEFLIYDKCLSAANITSLYAAGAPYRREASGTYDTSGLDIKVDGSPPVADTKLFFICNDIIPDGTTLTYEITYSMDDGANYGDNAGSYDDGHWVAINNGGEIVLDGDITTLKFRASFASDTDQLITPILISLQVRLIPIMRIINEFRLYSHATLGGIKEFKAQYWDGAAWTDITPTKYWGYNRNASPEPVLSLAGNVITTNATCNYIQFADIECAKLKLICTDTINADDDYRIVELEIYGVKDISSDVIYLDTDKGMDAEQLSFVGGSFNLELQNDTKKYSSSYKPTADEVASGYFNSELTKNKEVRIWTGFNVLGTDVWLQQILGVIDSIKPDPVARHSFISGRDRMKNFSRYPFVIDEDEVVSKSIENCLERVINRANFSSSEIVIGATGISLDSFFGTSRFAWDHIKKLIEVIPDTFAYINELGQFRLMRLQNVRNFIENNYEDFVAGTTKTKIDLTSEPGSILAEIEGGDIVNGDFEDDTTSGPINPQNWHAFGNDSNSPGLLLDGQGYQRTGDACANNYAYSGYPRFTGNGFGMYRSASIDPYVRVWVNDEVSDTTIANFKVYGNWVGYTVDLSAFKNKYIYIGFVSSQANGSSTSYYGGIYTDRFYCSGKTLTFYFKRIGYREDFYHEYWWSSEYVCWYYFAIDDVTGGRRTYYDGITGGKEVEFVSQAHDTTNGGLEAVDSFKHLIAEVSKPIGTTITFYVQFSAATTGDFWGTDAGVFTDTNWETLTMDPDTTNSAIEVKGNTTGAITGGDNTVKRIRYKAVFTTTEEEITPRIYNVLGRWLITGNYALNDTADLSFAYEGALNHGGTLKSLIDSLSDVDYPRYNLFTVKASPLYEQTRETVAESDAANNNITLASPEVKTYYFDLSYPCAKNIGTAADEQYLVINGLTHRYRNGTDQVVAGDSVFDADVSVEFHANVLQPYAILTASGNATITEMYITAKPYKATGTFIYKIQSDDYDATFEDNGIQEFPIENEYVQSISHAEEIALACRNRLSKNISQAEGVRVIFTPEIQLWDCVSLYDINTGISALFYVIGINQSKQSGSLGETKLTLIKF